MNKFLKMGIGAVATVAGGWTVVTAFMGRRPAIPTPTAEAVTETFETVQDAVESVTEATA